MQIVDARHDPLCWHARHVAKRIAARHEAEIARAVVVTPQEFEDYVDGRSSPRVAAAHAEGRIVLVRDHCDDNV